LKWQYKIDEFNDDPIDVYNIVSPIYNGNQLDASEYYAIGTHRILWTVWDQCGNSFSQEHLFTIQNCKKPTPICVDGLGADLTNMGGTAMVMVGADFFDPGHDSYHSCGYPVIYSFSADTTDKTRTYFCNDTVGLVDIEMWVTVELEDGTLVQDFCETTLDVQDNMLACGGPLPYALVSGTITDEGNNAVTGVVVELEGSEFVDQVSDETGAFAFPEMNTGGTYRVNPTLNENHANGVSTLDLIHVQKHLLGLRAIDSPYKMIAADVNKDKKISASDLLNTRELILGVSDVFENNTSWRFIQKSYEFENEANPLTETYPEFELIENIQNDIQSNYIAIKIGDITNDASLNGLPVVESRNSNTLNLDIDNVTFNNSGAVEVPVYASDFNQINGFQFTLNFDANALSFNNIQTGVLNMGSANFFDTNTGNVTVSWSRAIAVDVEDDAVLFTLVFNAKKNGTLNEVMNINSALTRAEAYDADLEKLNVELSFRNMDMTDSYALFQNTPNPFSENTMISFNMKQAGHAQITIYDLNGKVVKVFEGNYDKGVQEIPVSKYDLPVNGMLYYQMNTEGFTATKKMILVK